MKGKWIWINNDDNLKDQTVYFRKELQFDRSVKEIKINISLSDKYKLFVNGQFIGVGPSPATPKYQYYDTYEIDSTELSIDKKVCISVIGYNLGRKTEIVTGRNQGIPAFIVDGEIMLADGTRKTFMSDESWKTIYSPGHYRDIFQMGESRISKWGGFKEVFVSGKEPKGWKEVAYDDSKWQNAVEVNSANEYFNLIPREIPFLHMDQIYPDNVLQIEKYNGDIVDADNILKDNEDVAVIDASIPGSYPAIVLDFGKEVVGYLQIELKGSKDSNMSIWYGESLDLMRVDTLILDGEWQVYEPFHRRAFRYIKLVFNNSLNKIKLKKVELLMTHYDYRDIGVFNSKDSLLNNIYEVSKYTVKIGSQEHFEDSIWREEMQWLADARVMSLVNYWVYGDYELPAKAIKQFFRIQLEDGMIPASGPQRMEAYNSDFCMHFIEMIYEHYYYSGDTSIIYEYYPNMVKLMNRFEQMEDIDGLLKQDGKMGVFLDWAFIDKREKITAVNCYYHKTLKVFVEMSRIIGKNDLDKYIDKANKLKETIYSKMYNNDKQLFTDCLVGDEQSEHYSQQTNMFAVYGGIVDDKIEEFINRIYDTEGLEVIKGAFLLSFVVDLLFEHGLNDKAMFLLKDFWGEMISRGATTWWETFDRSTPHSSIPYLFTKNTPTYLTEYIPVSHCHGWGAGPAYILPKYILGIKSLKPCFKEIEFSPYTNGIDGCEGRIPTPYGEIEVEWVKDKNGKIEYNINKPDEIVLKINLKD